MGKKLPYIQFYTGDWLKDPSLSKCSPATRGIWVDAICAMHESDQSGALTGSLDELSRALRCSTDDLQAAVAELQKHKTADVHLCNELYTLINRRMRREWKEREDAAERQRRHREKNGHASVTPLTEDDCDVVFPEKLNTPEFHAAWRDWVQHRREIRKKLTPKAVETQLKHLAEWGPKRAIAAIGYSIGNGWTGIFEEREGTGAGRVKAKHPTPEEYAETMRKTRERQQAFEARTVEAMRAGMQKTQPAVGTLAEGLSEFMGDKA
jgi:hypothetical protein